MIQNPETGALTNFDFDRLLQHVPEIKQIIPDIYAYAFEPPIDSSDMDPNFWQELAGVIYSNYERYDDLLRNANGKRIQKKIEKLKKSSTPCGGFFVY